MIIPNQDRAFPGGSISGLPVQAIPSRKKDRKWKEACMDALESIGMRQMTDNLKLMDFYRMKDNKLSFMETKEALPHLDKIGDLADKLGDIPSFIKHYDLIGTIVNAFVGQLTNLSSKYSVVGTDEDEVNEYMDTKQDILIDYVRKAWDIRLRQKMLAQGMDPDYNDFQSEEERRAYVDQINQAKVAMTPEEIERWMNTKWKSKAAAWASDQLEADKSRFYMDELDEDNFVDLNLSGRCFRHFLVGYDYYKVERWHPVEVFYPVGVDVRYPQYAEYIGRIHYYGYGDIISRFGHMLTAKQKQQIVGGDENYFYSNGGGAEYKGSKKASIAGLYGSTYVPWEGYFDYQAVTAVEDFMGIPLGRRVSLDENGKEVVQASFMPRFQNYGYSNMAYRLAGTTNLRTDLYQATEAYWVSYKRVLCIKYITESGMTTQTLVTDDILPEFLKENGIEKVSKITFDEKEDQKINTYFEEYVPEVRRGIKISGGNLREKAIYLDCEPIEHQIPGNSNMYDYCLPVAGYIGESLANKIQPWQVLYNLAMNQLYNNMEKEIGLFFVTDPMLFPSEYRDWYEEDSKSAMATMMEGARDTGVFPVDSPKSVVSPGANAVSNFNQFKVQDMRLSATFQDRMNIAEFAKRMAYESIGITPQMMGTPLNYQTSTGVKQGAEASYMLTQIYFSHFDYFKRRALDMHLAVAQRCQKEGRDWTVMYTKSDLTKSFLKISDDSILARQLGVFAMADSKHRMKLEQFRQYLMNINTAGSDALDFARIMDADSMAELKQAAFDSREYQDAIRRQQQENERETLMQKAEADKENLEMEHRFKLEQIDRKGQWDVRRESVLAAGRAADSQSDERSMEFVQRSTENALKEKIADSNFEFRNRQLDSQSDIRKKELELKERELELKARQLDQRREDNQTKRFTSIVNN